MTLAGLAVAVLAAEALAPARAVASCGDYVSVAGDEQRPVSKQRPCSRPDHSCPYQSLPGKAPCQGAECSKGEVPPLVPPTVPTQTSHEFTCLGVAPWAVDCPTTFRPADSTPVTPSHLTDSVFRPPRCS